MNDKRDWIIMFLFILVLVFLFALVGLGLDGGYKKGQIDYQNGIVKYEIRADGTIWELQQNTGGE